MLSYRNRCGGNTMRLKEGSLGTRREVQSGFGVRMELGGFLGRGQLPEHGDVLFQQTGKVEAAG